MKLRFFNSAAEQLHVTHSAVSRQIRLLEDELGIRRDDFLWHKNIYATKVCDEKIGAVVKPNNRHHLNKQLTTLSRPLAWQDWYQYSGMQLAYTETSQYEHFYLAIQAALAGLGTTIASFLMVQDELHNQQLVAIKGFVKDNSSYYLLSPTEISPDSKQDKFKNWIIAEAEKCSKETEELLK